MKVGDLIRLSRATMTAQDLKGNCVLLISKSGREDALEYDWEALCDGKIVGFGRQIENMFDVISEG